MRSPVIFSVISILLFILSGNALAASIYKPGDISAGGGYSGSSYSIGNIAGGNGFMGQVSYFITDVWAITGQWYSSPLQATSGLNITENILSIEVVRHIGFNDSFGFYSSIGYGNGTLSVPAPFVSTSGGGLIFELGLEAKLIPHIVGFIGYRGITMNNKAINTGKYSNEGFNAGLNYIF